MTDERAGALVTVPRDRLLILQGLLGQATSTIKILSILVADTQQRGLEEAAKLAGLLGVWPGIAMDVIEAIISWKEAQGDEKISVLMQQMRDLAVDPLKAAYGVLSKRFRDHPFTITAERELLEKVTREKPGDMVNHVVHMRQCYAEAIAKIILFSTSKEPMRPNEDARLAYDTILKEVGL